MIHNHDNEYFSELPYGLRAKAISCMLLGPSLDSMLGEYKNMLTRRDKDTLTMAFAKAATMMHLKSGTKILSKGEEARHVYIVDQGEVAIVMPYSRITQVLAAPIVMSMGSVFAAAIPECGIHRYTAIAATNCVVWQIDCGALMNKGRTISPRLLLAVLRQFKHRFEQISVRDLATVQLTADEQQKISQEIKNISSGIEKEEHRLLGAVQALEQFERSNAMQHGAGASNTDAPPRRVKFVQTMSRDESDDWQRSGTATGDIYSEESGRSDIEAGGVDPGSAGVAVNGDQRGGGGRHDAIDRKYTVPLVRKQTIMSRDAEREIEGSESGAEGAAYVG